MIVPMKKITVVVQSKDTKATLNSLGKIGVIHVVNQNIPTGENVKELQNKILSLTNAISSLEDTKYQKTMLEGEEELSKEILALVQEKEILEEESKKRQRDISHWQEWGDFDPGIIQELRSNNLRVELAKISKKQKKSIPAGVAVETLFKKGGFLYCVLISRDDIKLPFEVLQPPKIGLSIVLDVQKKDDQRIKDIEKKLTLHASHKKALYNYREHLKSILQFHEVLAGMGKSGELSYLRGYIPYNHVTPLEKAASRHQWGILVEDPEPEDNVPTLIKNPQWVEIIKPVFDMIKALPGYKEIDISVWFLLFFSVFFGILIGDFGYGAIVFGFNLLLQRKLKEKMDDMRIFYLMYVLSFCAMVWGLLTGTFFGQAWLPSRVQPLMPFLAESKNVQALCFFIGALHLSIAHMWRGIMKFPHLKFLSEIGWICMLWGVFFLARVLILDAVFPVVAKQLFITGITLIILFSNPTKNILKSVGFGFKELLLNMVNSFTDVVSYIRLFAVGTATVAVADAFNQMAVSSGGSGIIGGLVTVLILIFGHTLNIILGAMSILVHGVRLNVLEFSSHLNMEWSGVPYDPYKSKEIKED